MVSGTYRQCCALPSASGITGGLDDFGQRIYDSQQSNEAQPFSEIKRGFSSGKDGSGQRSNN
jgi:hypothetical protein